MLHLIGALLSLFIIGTISVGTHTGPLGNERPGPPNILFVLFDDLGWSDISAKGGQFPTPHLDDLYLNSIQLNRHYIHLMCSPSRTQFMTGRYAMYQGINKMTPWSYTQIGGIPVGQPTVAQWLRDFGDYTTYGIGKWHMGYAYEGLLPLNKGFDHWYGFMQCEVQYASKKFCDTSDGQTDFYDFWDDDRVAWEADGENSMYQYSERMQKIFAEEGEKQREAGEFAHPFYMSAHLQTMHGPLPAVHEFIDDCEAILAEASEGEFEIDALQEDGSHKQSVRARYCESTLLTDKVIGEMVSSLKENNLWEDTLIVVTTDNGADLDNEGSNYPLRGTKGTPFEGNIRTLAFVTGGVVARSIDHDNRENNVRHGLFSNLDWTPTLLDYAGLLKEIKTKDYTWDGYSQWDHITFGDAKKARDHIVMNIGDSEMDSSYMVFEYQNKLYKYMHASDDAIDRWSWYRVNGWSQYTKKHNFILDMKGQTELLDQDDPNRVKEWFYDLIEDEREESNLWDEVKKFQPEIIDHALGLMRPYIEHPLWSYRIVKLWQRIAGGNPALIDDGKVVRPFLSKKGYFSHIETLFQEAEEEDGVGYSGLRRHMYFNEWIVPAKKTKAGSKSRSNALAVFNLKVYGLYAGIAGVFASVILFALVYFGGKRMKDKMAQRDFTRISSETAPLMESQANRYTQVGVH